MTAPIAPRGGAPVGFLTELPEIEAASVRYLRQWCESETTQQQAINDLNDVLGPKHGPLAAASLRQMCDLFSQFARRPVMRHQVGCSCLGADEACFANLVAEATAGHREDALLFSLLIVRADFAPALASLAEQFGMTLLMLNRPKSRPSRDRSVLRSTVH